MTAPGRLLLSVFVLLFSCATPADPDGDPTTAGVLPLGRAWTDSLDCARGDCVDWFRVQVTEGGKLRVRSRSTTENASYSIEVTRMEGGSIVARQGSGSLVLESPIESGEYLIRISAAAESEQPVAYQLIADWRPPSRRPPPPRPQPAPEPQFETRSGEVLELEGAMGDPDHVLFSLGRGEQMQAGFEGRLIRDGRSIARIRVIEVFGDGSRARIEGALSEPITPDTIVEIDVPAE